MARVVKTAAERKAEFVDCAQALFFAKGYEKTTISDILERTGLSRGAFYHHFASKEDLLEALTERVVGSMVAASRDVIEDDKVDTLTKLNWFFAAGRSHLRMEPSVVGAFAAMYKQDNALLLRRVTAAVAKAAVPILTQIIARGVARGELDVPDAKVVAEVLFDMGQPRESLVLEIEAAVAKGEIDAAERIAEHRRTIDQILVDRILGLPPGSIVLSEPGHVREMLVALSDALRDDDTLKPDAAVSAG